MISSYITIRRIGRAVAIPAAAALVVLSLGAAAGAHQTSGHPKVPATSYSFQMVPPAGATCLHNAHGHVTIVKGSLNDTMTVTVRGLPKNTGFDLFVLQQPEKPFGVAWYQTDVETGRHGTGTAVVRGIFNKETFSVSVGGTVTFPPTHQYHLGLWFNSPTKSFDLGCDGVATSPVVTPFNGEQHAGVQVLNTSNFPDGAGPLSHVRGG
jgi:hypothetical protein